ncbi:MAG: GGDEF domain-containing protein [Thermomonas sp.]|uniref:GGDEF domain-containing protein n=1 Tax=Thermomonas sp. TaxID=1971895 RepID=UPI0039E5428E
MNEPMSGLRDVWSHLRERPDALMLELGTGGELLVARLRAALSLLILLFPLINVLDNGSWTETLAGFVGAIPAIVMAQVWLALARQRGRHAWLPYATATYDVSLTTLVLVLLAMDSPAIGLNSMVAWSFYLLAVAMTALRNDGRLALYAGALAFVQYALLVSVVFALHGGSDALVSLDYGTVTVSNQLQRLILIVLMTMLTATIVYRMQRLVQMSGTDGLTGLPNRTLLVHRFPAAMEQARERGGSLSVCLIDLDYFKRINDTLGHHVGDRALRHVVDVLQQQMETGDWLARLGGEEFVLVMPTPTGRTWERLEALRRSVASAPFLPEPDADPIRLTFSAGVASWPGDGGDLSQLLRKADLRLRQAKLGGRNQSQARDD